MTNAQRNLKVMRLLEVLLGELQIEMTEMDTNGNYFQEDYDNLSALINNTEAAIDLRMNEWFHTDMYNAQYEGKIDEDLMPCHTIQLGIAVALRKQILAELHPEIKQCKIDDYNILD